MSPQSLRARRDRWSDWAVIAVLVVALLLGWAVMVAARGQRTTLVQAELGLTVEYPRDWLIQSGQELVFRAVDSQSGAWPTAYEVRLMPIEAGAPLTPTLTMVLNNASLTRARQSTAYQLLDLVPGKEIDGQPTMEASYVLVAQADDPYLQRMPAVMLGLDVALAREGQAAVFSLVAPEDSFESAERAFRDFVRSAEIGPASVH
jgi:hypothetical protein